MPILKQSSRKCELQRFYQERQNSAMFETGSCDWNTDTFTEELNRSLFGNLEIPKTRGKKNSKQKHVKDFNRRVEKESRDFSVVDHQHIKEVGTVKRKKKNKKNKETKDIFAKQKQSTLKAVTDKRKNNIQETLVGQEISSSSSDIQPRNNNQLSRKVKHKNVNVAEITDVYEATSKKRKISCNDIKEAIPYKKFKKKSITNNTFKCQQISDRTLHVEVETQRQKVKQQSELHGDHSNVKQIPDSNFFKDENKGIHKSSSTHRVYNVHTLKAILDVKTGNTYNHDKGIFGKHVDKATGKKQKSKNKDQKRNESLVIKVNNTNNSNSVKTKASKNNDASKSDVKPKEIGFIEKCNPSDKKSALYDKMKERLNAARFRYLNEKLYTTTSKDALRLFAQDQDAFKVYHGGFQSQVNKWPVNPVDRIVQYIKSRPLSLVIADFGCGEAKIAQSIPNKVHSFDLVATNQYVTVCDIAKVPLKDCSIDIVVICLALMGTNWKDFLSEANRVLKKGGILKLAEVTSRIESTQEFVKLLQQFGFCMKYKDTSNKMFVLLELQKTGLPTLNKVSTVQLLPCVYKKR